MDSKIEQLCNTCNLIGTKTYSSDDSQTLEYNERNFGEYSIFISLIKADKNNLIFINILKDNNLIFKGLYKKSFDDLKNSYKKLMKDLKLMGLNEFINNYYDSLINSAC